MKLSSENLKKYYFGAYFFEEDTDGYLLAYQHSKEQMEYFRKTNDFWYERSFASNAKTLEFITDADSVSFDYKFVWQGSPDSFELAEDGLITDIRYIKRLDNEGRLSFSLSEGEKHVTIYLPADSTVVIKDLEISTDQMPKIPQKKDRVLWLGDSITQGYGPLRSGMTYVSVANRILNYDIINQGIGAFIYDADSLMELSGYDPDKIIVSLGTNQFGDESIEPVRRYYERLIGLYGSKTPILCITPIWRGDLPSQIPKFLDYCEQIKHVASSYANVKIVDGLKLVPHLEEYYIDNLHPNCLGTQAYGFNLAKSIESIGF